MTEYQREAARFPNFETDVDEIDQLASLARTALTDPHGLPAGVLPYPDEEGASYIALTRWHAKVRSYAVDRLDEIIGALNPAELTPAAAAEVATVLGRQLAGLLERLEAEGTLEAGRSVIGDQLNGALDLIDSAIDALNACDDEEVPS